MWIIKLNNWIEYYLHVLLWSSLYKYQNLLVFYKKTYLMEVQVEVIYLTKLLACLSHAACENRRHFLRPSLISPRNDVWETSAETFHADGMTNQKHYPDVGSDASSVWNFCDHFSDVISWGNRWWHRKMLSVFSG